MINELMRISVYKSLHKPNLILGAEREPLLISAILPVALTASSFNLYMLATSIVFWIISLFFLRHMAKIDPDLGKIWLRYIKYQNFYPAQTSVWRKDTPKKKK